MPYEKKPQSLDPHRWVVFGVFSAVYFFVFFHRVSTSVIAHDLLTTFHTHATALGLMSSMYFYAYALEQPVVGFLSDRLGPRKVVGFWSLAAAAGCVLFGLAPTIGWASVGRAVIGFGVGGVYVPALKALSQWFRKKEFATMTGLVLAAGNLGAIVATTPLAWMAHTCGWRSSFLIIGGVTLGLAFVTLLLIRDHDPTVESNHSKNPLGQEQKTNPEGTALLILTSLRFWVLAVVFCSAFGTYLTFQGLWATPYLMTMLNLGSLTASQLNMLLPVGFILGATLSGWLSDRIFGDKVRLLISLLAIQTGSWAVLTFGDHALGTAGMIPLLLLMGGASGGLGTTLWAVVRDTTPAPIMGLTTGLLNPAPFVGVAILQIWTGAILDRFGLVDGIYPSKAYNDVFLVFLLITFGCLILFTCCRKHLYKKH
jgi:sugar phosphate permease